MKFAEAIEKIHGKVPDAISYQVNGHQLWQLDKTVFTEQLNITVGKIQRFNVAEKGQVFTVKSSQSRVGEIKRQQRSMLNA
jgi:hypothetical protein